ncbi:hypothetical protein H5410_037359 [Solanum commersonii]|uniref:Uncharacterized protein n=1 Tax=Solanum commersonii TaxID=4109 RepID=A0A9J5Y893_SOLCO|nr:hypothetical protein H5410_037359 [Solanum commersonii]
MIDSRVNNNTVLSVDVVGCLYRIGVIESNYLITDLCIVCIVRLNFSTTYARKIYANLDIDYIRSLVSKFSTVSTEVQFLASSNINGLPIEKETFLNSMDIKELEWSFEI